ncbi:MAG: Kojibiose phosphorylase [Haloplasmataceae bacterium]|jgi:maltose phosphorylase|nr:Kojibiose phosphorylase [Haloplasmataceae bacterium]
MAKIAYEYFKVDPWKVIEEGFNPKRNKVSESIFSLGNEYMGVRGYIDEGASCDSLLGSYFNGIYENGVDHNASHYKGIVTNTHFMVNSVNWLFTKIYVDGDLLDINKANIKDFKRVLDFKTGDLTRSFSLITKTGKVVKFTFRRFLSMKTPNYGYQNFKIESNDDVEVKMDLGLDFSILQWGKNNYWNILKHDFNEKFAGFIGKTITTNQLVFSGYELESNTQLNSIPFTVGKIVGHHLNFTVLKNQAVFINKKVTNLVVKNNEINHETLWIIGLNKLENQNKYDIEFNDNIKYWDSVWSNFDIEIVGDDKNQQGIRFCIFQLQQTYHGVDESNNIGAKGLTGEAYSGHAFWDTETYCLPYFIFNNPNAARNLLMFRYNTLEQARKRAIDLDCKGACYPIATLNGNEACTLWQHASLQFQPSTAVAYGVWHYVKNTHDQAFLYNYGLEMLVEISRFMLTRGQWNAKHTKFGYYAVMGPDEFQMMVNHNCYTNYMAKKTLEYTIEVLSDYKSVDYEKYQELTSKLNITDQEINDYVDCAKAMYIPVDKDTLLYEQHEGFFDLPHIDVDSIPVEDFPLYSHWSYDRIYRNDMIKQPDVLMFMFLHNQDFDKETKLANYNYYEPRCIHESSLSPSIHSIFAAELDKVDEAVKFFGFATRMDIDDYNRNAHEGLHTTSIAAAWVNIVYGFGGFRSDGQDLVLNPIIPNMWKQYSFKFKYFGSLITVKVNRENIEITCDGKTVDMLVYNHKYHVGKEKLVLPVKNKRD